MKTIPFRVAVLAICCFCGLAGADGGYVIVVSRATLADPQWKPVCDALVTKHHAKVVSYDKSIDEALDALREQFPRHVCFVATPAETGREFVAQVNRLTRRFDDDPYTDALWGILTGYDAACALRTAKQAEPLVIHRVAAGTEVELACCDEGAWYCELKQGRMVRKLPGQPPKEQTAPPDTTAALVAAINDYKAQLFVTSGHATEKDWQIGYRYRNGQFRCEKGQLFGLDTAGKRYPVLSDNPKVYLAVGNCLMGHVNGPDAMALAWMNSAGVVQMVGYTVPTWYGYAGWGMLDYFVEQPGRFTLAEAFYANQQALVHRLTTNYQTEPPATQTNDAPKFELTPAGRQLGLKPNDARGLMYDCDNIAFYGDPAWEARMADGPLAWKQTLTEKDGLFTLTVTPCRDTESFAPVNRNGSQRGGRPIFLLLPRRIRPQSVRITEGSDLKPVVTDNFILVPLPAACEAERTYRVSFKAQCES